MYYKYCLGLVGFVSYEQFCRIIDTVIYCEFNFTVAGNVLKINQFDLMLLFKYYADIVLQNQSRIYTSAYHDSERLLQFLNFYEQSVTEDKILEVLTQYENEVQSIRSDLIAQAPPAQIADNSQKHSAQDIKCANSVYDLLI